MGCTNSTKKSFSDDQLKTNGKGLNNSAYASSEFDLPTSDSDDEMLSISIFNNNLTKKTISFASGLTTVTNNNNNTSSSTANTTLLDNRMTQTSI